MPDPNLLYGITAVVVVGLVAWVAFVFKTAKVAWAQERPAAASTSAAASVPPAKPEITKEPSEPEAKKDEPKPEAEEDKPEPEVKKDDEKKPEEKAEGTTAEDKKSEKKKEEDEKPQ